MADLLWNKLHRIYKRSPDIPLVTSSYPVVTVTWPAGELRDGTCRKFSVTSKGIVSLSSHGRISFSTPPSTGCSAAKGNRNLGKRGQMQLQHATTIETFGCPHDHWIVDFVTPETVFSPMVKRPTLQGKKGSSRHTHGVAISLFYASNIVQSKSMKASSVSCCRHVACASNHAIWTRS